MSILLYCVADKSGTPPSTGVANLPVSRSECNEIVALFSKGASGEVLTGAPLPESARAFHSVLQQVFETGAIIPFRFPTLMGDEEELAAHLQENFASYSSSLRKFKNSVQMEAAIRYSDSTPALTTKTSGTEYLRGRQKHSEELQRAAGQLRTCVGEAATGWRDRSVQNTLRIFALVDRDRVAAFKDTMRAFKVPCGLSVRVTGPWPVTEFLDADKL